MGGADVAAGRGDPQPGRHPDLPLPRHRRPRSSPPCGGPPTTSAASTRPRPCPPAPTTPRDRARGAAAIVAGRARAGPDGAHRGRVEAAARRLRHPDRRDPRRRRPRTRPSPPPTAIGYPGRAQAPLRDDHAQDRRRRRAARTWPTPTPSAAPSRAIETVGARARRRRALPGRDRPADGPPRRLRADRRQQPRPAVRPGAALRHGRPARRGLQGPRARPCRR